MRKLIAERGLDDKVFIDSAGTIGYHAGNPSDNRSREAGERRGYVFDHRARQVTPGDFHVFDYILAMDAENLQDLKRIQPSGSTAELSLFLSHCTTARCREVPDPYYGGQRGFEHVLDLVEQGCEALLERIVREHALG